MTGQKPVSHLLVSSRPDLLTLLLCLILTLRFNVQSASDTEKEKKSNSAHVSQSSRPGDSHHIPKGGVSDHHFGTCLCRQNHCQRRGSGDATAGPRCAGDGFHVPASLKNRYHHPNPGRTSRAVRCRDIVRELDNEGGTGWDVRAEWREPAKSAAVIPELETSLRGPLEAVEETKKSSRPWRKSVTWDISSRQKHKDVFHRGQKSHRARIANSTIYAPALENAKGVSMFLLWFSLIHFSPHICVSKIFGEVIIQYSLTCLQIEEIIYRTPVLKIPSII